MEQAVIHARESKDETKVFKFVNAEENQEYFLFSARLLNSEYLKSRIEADVQRIAEYDKIKKKKSTDIQKLEFVKTRVDLIESFLNHKKDHEDGLVVCPIEHFLMCFDELDEPFMQEKI